MIQAAKGTRGQPRRRSKNVATSLPLEMNADSRRGARTEYRVYPSIGIARIGDSKDGFVVGPEAPGVAPSGPFRGEKDHGIKPQAARFRIYRVEIDANESELVTEEVVAGASVKIEWSVRLANRKAAGNRIFVRGDGGTLGRTSSPLSRNDGLDREKLVISAQGRVGGGSASRTVLSGEIEFAKPGSSGARVQNIELATLRTDESGRLLVVGGPGKSETPTQAKLPSFSDNDGWYDSVSDGPVEARLTIEEQVYEVVPAWVLVTVPRYAPETYAIITWYDRAVNMARINADGTFSPPKTTSFTRDIYPVLKRGDGLSAVHRGTHAGGQAPLSDSNRIARFATSAARTGFVAKLTPIGTNAGQYERRPITMPQLNSGANPDPSGPVWAFLALTEYQMAHFRNWAAGNFFDDWPGSEPPPPAFDKIPVTRRAWALTEAALETCTGGAFFPGIEGTYDMARVETYHPEANLRQEFRINPTHPAGFLTEKMALPWQADFADCGDYWWPSQRPVTVTTASGAKQPWARGVTELGQEPSHLKMVSDWTKLGFVVRDETTGKFIETERTLTDLVS